MKSRSVRLLVQAAILIAAIVLSAQHATAQSPEPEAQDSRLLNEIAEQDKALFEAFNAYDLEGVARFLDENIEFYHDIDGLLSKAQVLDGTRSLFSQDNGLRRELVPGSLRVYPIPEYGAMQLGEHRFCHMEDGKEDCGVFQFANVWRRKEGRWSITRVLSYGHPGRVAIELAPGEPIAEDFHASADLQ
ncbi:MAG TPA: nuclear transport factor 2 family protein [Acidobacteriota bacterium]|nr:nuclear transport factor 2 family protein [Acidobacteriota bacterium]